MKQLVAVIAIATTFGLTACGGDDSPADVIRDRAIDQGLDEGIAQCVADYLEENLSDDDLQAPADTTNANDLNPDALAVATESLVVCNVP